MTLRGGDDEKCVQNFLARSVTSEEILRASSSTASTPNLILRAVFHHKSVLGVFHVILFLLKILLLETSQNKTDQVPKRWSIPIRQNKMEEHALVEHFPKVRGSQIEGHDPIIRSGSADWTMAGPVQGGREGGRAAAGIVHRKRRSYSKMKGAAASLVPDHPIYPKRKSSFENTDDIF